MFINIKDRSSTNKIYNKIMSIFIVRGDTYHDTPPYLIQTDDPRPIGLQIEINH